MLPLVFHHLRRQAGDLGAVAGRLYAWNTVGSLLGALVGGYLLFFWLDLDQVYRVAVGAALASALLLTLRLVATARLATGLGIGIPAFVALLSLPPWNVDHVASGAFRTRFPTQATAQGPTAFFASLSKGHQTVFHDDDPNSTVTVKRTPLGGRRFDHAIATNGKPDGSIEVDYPTMALAALVPALFADRVEQGFVIGYGTGVTVGELAALEGVQRVTVAEISPGVIEAARFFEPYNQGAQGNPKTEILIADAYRALLRSDTRYDVIASEPSNPWVTGVEMLFSREFLQAARDRLRPGGVYCQWFHLYENDTQLVELVFRTYASVFDHVAVWYSLGPDLLLLGMQEPRHALDLERLRARATRPDVAAGLRRAGITSFPALLAHELLPLDVVNAAGFEGDVQTLLHPVLSHRAGRAFFRGYAASLPPTVRPVPAALGARHSLLRRLAEASGGRLPDDVHAAIVTETCRTAPLPCATLLARWQYEHPTSPARAALLATYRAEGRFPAQLAQGQLDALASLYDPARTAAQRATPEQARHRTQLFIEYYHHGAPFSREALAALWDRCVEGRGAGARCAQGLAAAEQQLGPLRRAADAGAGVPPG
jgi:spermidine synthase